MTTQSLKFSGHESFHCRPFWLKKGYDFVNSNQKFTEKSGIDLGVGRNMVNGIRFWLKAFDIVDENNELTSLSKAIFEDKEGWDPFLEDEATLWLLHYMLSSKNYSSTYYLIFSELRKTRPEFTKKHFFSKVNEIDSKQSENNVLKDFSVFTRTYFAKKSKDKEENFSGLFTDLRLLKEIGKDNKNETIYHIDNSKQSTIPWQVILYCIVENKNYSDSISFRSLYSDKKGVGTLFVFNQEELEDKLIEISENISSIVYKNDAGTKELQFKEGKPIGLDILKQYYNE